MNRERW